MLAISRCGRSGSIIIACFSLLFVLNSTAEAKRHFATATPKPTPSPTPTSSASPTSTPSPAAACITITAPTNNAVVSGNVPIGTDDTCSGMWFERLYVDNVAVADFAPGQVVFDSTGYVNGYHTIEVASQSENPGSVMLGDAIVQLNVQNAVATATPSSDPSNTPSPSPSPIATNTPDPTKAPTASPTPLPTFTPLATPSPTPTPSCISISSPAPGAIVSGSSVAISTHDTCSGMWFESLYVDTLYIGDFPPDQVVFNSTNYANGMHTIKVTSQSENPGSVELGSAAVQLNVENGAATATATVSPTPPAPTSTATPSAHLSNLPPGATLPSESTCATLANQSNFPENIAQNVNDGTGWDYNNQIWTTPSYFYANAGRNGLAPSADFAAVDGNYAGSTQDIIRWSACKWGVDEDWAYAESSQEHGWVQACAQLHGGTTCNGGGDCNNPDSDSGGETANLSFMGFPVTNSSAAFVGVNGYGDSNGSSCSGNYASWGIIQSKVQSFEWYTWPMIALSTAWGEDYRWAKYRACVNGDYANWFGNNSDYLNAVSRAKSNPNGLVPSGQAGPTNLFTNETNLQYLALGCIGTHYSGQWYDSGAVSYLTSSGWGFLYILNNAAWPGGLK